MVVILFNLCYFKYHNFYKINRKKILKKYRLLHFLWEFVIKLKRNYKSHGWKDDALEEYQSFNLLETNTSN